MSVSQYGENRLPADEQPTVQMAAVSVSAEERPTIQIAAVTLPAEQRSGHTRPGPPAAGGWGNPGTDAGESSAPPPAARRGLRRTLLAVGTAAAVLVVGGTAAGGYAYAGEVPRGTSVLGVDLGGKSRSEAVSTLRADLDRRASTFTTPVPVRIGDRTGEISPAAVGLAVDVEATVEAAAAHRPGPVSLLFGSRAATPVVAVDVEKLDTELRRIIGRTGPQMTLPAITFTGTTPKPVYPKPSKGIRPDDSAKAVRDGWLRGQPVVVPLVETHPVTTTEEVDRLITELARPAVATPVSVNTDRGAFTIPPAAIAKSLVLSADKTGKIEPRVDEKKLRAALTSQLGKVEVKAKDASMSIQGNKPKMVAGAGGQQVDVATLARDLLPVLSKTDGRQVTAKLKAVQPKVSTEDLTKMGIKERVSTFTTNFTGGLSSSRSQNIVTIARDVDGTLVKPGETFSLNGHTGERGYAQGYRDAPVILDGKLVPGVGGGTSQFTTTLFNATYYAGLEDVEHKPHSYWFSRYPAVIESTIFWPSLDFKFRNDTPHGVLIDTSHTSSSITVSIWSTKVYDKVSTEYSPRRNITKPKVIKLAPGPSCIPTNGIDGFTQDAFRVFRKDGKVLKREKFTWKYLAEPRYSCG
ncbi:VanW family protein [Plantactinospora sp. S1510]|uniref:VanW family protein n=1 Tax=Plantactinospora alkalitolerans TaxID=2789879 RepID=A0ABS0H528_9ACTN|nr:VanW family protein [Plantactinospora alkalitolerans]MBF9133313.1 VanW family protein [Plantactinospora alkalitolerans]